MSSLPAAQLTELQTLKRMSATRALLWKQFNDFVPLFIAIGFASLLFGAINALVVVRGADFGRIALQFAGLFACGFALTACSIAFATESESRTREFLSGLPVSSFHIGAVKLLASLAAVVLVFAMQIGLAAVFTCLRSMFFEADSLTAGLEPIYQGWSTVAIFTAVVFVASSISSSYFPNSLLSAICVCPLMFILGGCAWTWHLSAWPGDGAAVPMEALRFAQAFLLLGVAGSIVLPLFWLRRKPLSWKRSASTDSVDHFEDDWFWASLPGKVGIKTPGWLETPGRDRFKALCWQSLRQQMMLPFLALVSAGLMVWLFDMVFKYHGLPGKGMTSELMKATQTCLMITMAFTGYGFGWGTLYRDKLNSNLNFFQHHREHGRELLLARLMLPMILLLATVFAGYYAIDYFTGNEVSIWLPLFSGVFAFSATLMWSMAVRSYVYTLAIGLALTLIGYIASWKHDTSQMSSWIAVLPSVWLLTCFAYAPAWLAGRSSAAWMAWFAFVSLITYAVPLWYFARWILGIA